MLDFTDSLYIAAFFAIDACKAEDAAVWAINTIYLFNAAGTWSGQQTIDEMNERNIAIVERILGGETSAPGVLHVQPERLNQRMSIQKGTFLFPKDVTKPAMDNLSATLGLPIEKLHMDPSTHVIVHDLDCALFTPEAPVIVKIILPRSIHEDILSDLRAMNIDANSLFPGLDGFARSLNTLLRMPELVRQRVLRGEDLSHISESR